MALKPNLCKTCGETNPELFYKGRRYECKGCRKAYDTAYREGNRDKIRGINRRYVLRIRAKTEEYQKECEAKNKKLKVCNDAVALALNLGNIKKDSCRICGYKEVIGLHHDLDKPLDIVWYCKLHHAQESFRLGAQK